MLELKMVKRSIFPNVLEAMLGLIDVVNVDCSSTGLTLKATDTERVTVITNHIPVEEFEHYHCDEGLCIGLPIDDMVNAIRCANKDDTITIKFDDENLDTITLSFESPEKNNTMAYNLRLVDDDSKPFHFPDWQDLDKYDTFVKMPSAEFMRVCKYLSNIDINVHISVNKEGLQFFATGKSGHLLIKYMQPIKATATGVTMPAPVPLTLDLKYMCSIAKICHIRYFLAPKIEEEEIEEGKREGDDKDNGSVRKKKAKMECCYKGIED